MRLLALALLGFVACAGGSPATTSSSAATTTATSGSIGSSGGSTSGGTCAGAVCSSDTDCEICGPGYACGIGITNTCCGEVGTTCLVETDCCSGYCAGEGSTSICENQPGPGASSSGTTAAAASTSTGAGTSSSGSSSSTIGTTSGAAVSSTVSSGSISSSSSGGVGTTGGGTTGGSTGGSGPPFAFSWTFGVSQTCEQANVAWVAIGFNGETPGIFPCRDPHGFEGATIPAPSNPDTSASYSVTAYDGVFLEQLGTISGQTTVPLAGTTSIPVTVPLMSAQSSQLEVNWTFDGLTGSQAAIQSIAVALTNPKNPSGGVNETLDGGTSGIDLGLFGPGVYPFTLTGTGPTTYTASGAVTANGITPALVLADLAANSSGQSGNVSITFGSGFAGMSCGAAGYDLIGVQLARADGTSLGAPAILSCADAGTSYVFAGLAAPATAFLWLEGISGATTMEVANPQIVLSPGVTANYTVIAQPPP